jgi:hypothetical protein
LETRANLADKEVHQCTQVSETAFEVVENHEEYFKKFTEAIRKVLVAYEINLGKYMDKATESRCRAIYTCNLLVDSLTHETQI